MLANSIALSVCALGSLCTEPVNFSRPEAAEAAVIMCLNFVTFEKANPAYSADWPVVVAMLTA